MLIAKRREFNLETHMAFIDFEKAFDRIDRRKIWGIMTKRGYPEHLINTIKSLYEETKIVINTGSVRTEEISINQGVRQGCSLSPTLFNIYIDDLVREWKTIVSTGIKLNHHVHLNLLLFADDLTIIQASEDDLQRAVHKLNQLCLHYNLTISIKKTKVMAHRGKFPVRTKIIMDNQPLEQISHFEYLGCNISYEVDHDIENKINKFQRICGTINRTLRNKTRKDTKIKFYKTMAVPILTYGSESWVVKETDKRKLQAAEMRFLRKVKGCTRRDQIRNEDIRQELGIYNLNEKIANQREQWKQHLSRMHVERIPAMVKNYKPQGKRDVGRPWRRW